MMTHAEQSAVVTVDMSDPDLLVQSCSQGFTMRIGRLALGTPLLRVVRRSDDFLLWLQAAVNAAVMGGDRPHHHVTLNMRHGQVKATCRIVVETDEENEEVVDMEGVRLLFFDIRQKGAHSGRGLGTSPTAGSQLRGTPVVHMSM
eukprot:UN1312